MSPDSLARLVVFVIIFLFLMAVRRRREAIRHAIRRIFIVEVTYLGVAYLLAQIGRSPVESILGGILIAIVVNQWMPGRSRHIPASVKRRKIAEYERTTGEKYNPRKVELDHVIPFSKGGSHTEDNLRIVEKRKNRSKGARSPWWDFLGR